MDHFPHIDCKETTSPWHLRGMTWGDRYWGGEVEQIPELMVKTKTHTLSSLDPAKYPFIYNGYAKSGPPLHPQPPWFWPAPNASVIHDGCRESAPPLHPGCLAPRACQNGQGQDPDLLRGRASLLGWIVTGTFAVSPIWRHFCR